MKSIGIETIRPKKKIKFNKVAKYKYPYLLKDVDINKPNKVWATDITYVKTPVGFVYLSALIDVYSRFIVS